MAVTRNPSDKVECLICFCPFFNLVDSLERHNWAVTTSASIRTVLDNLRGKPLRMAPNWDPGLFPVNQSTFYFNYQRVRAILYLFIHLFVYTCFIPVDNTNQHKRNLPIANDGKIFPFAAIFVAASICWYHCAADVHRGVTHGISSNC